MKRTVGLWILGFVVIALAGRGAVQEREVTLRFKFPANQTRTYEERVSGEMAMTFQLPGQEVPLTISLQGKLTKTERVESVDKEGVATLVVTAKGRIRAEVTGLPTEGPPEQDIPPIQTRLKVTPLGKVLEAQVKLPEELGKGKVPFSPNLAVPQMQGFSWRGFLLPENPVKPGDTWDISTKIDFKTEDRTVEVDVKGKARLLGFEKVDGRDCAVIETTVEIPDLGELVQVTAKVLPESKVDARSEGQATSKIWFDIAEGLIVRNETTVDMTMNYSATSATGLSFLMSMQGSFRSEERLTKVSQSEGKGD